MIFISLTKARKRLYKETIEESNKIIGKAAKFGVKVLKIYWVLGRYDTVLIYNAPDEKAAMKFALSAGDLVSTETLVAVTREDAIKLLE